VNTVKDPRPVRAPFALVRRALVREPPVGIEPTTYPGGAGRELDMLASPGPVNVPSVVDAGHHDFPLDLVDAIQDTEGAAPS
jgi:hypothetical protein